MPVNHYFGHHTNTYAGEQNLVDDLLAESIKIYGMDLYYLPRRAEKKDGIFGEDVLASFNEAYLIEMYFNNIEGFEGERNFLGKFGLELRKEASFLVSSRRFTETIQQGPGSTPPATIDDSWLRPKEGDLLYLPLTKDLWEIRLADHEQFFYQLGKVFVWELTVEKMIYGSQRIDTGVDDIDSIETDNTLTIDLSNEEIADNADLETEDTAAGDFTESNPFGDR